MNIQFFCTSSSQSQRLDSPQVRTLRHKSRTQMLVHSHAIQMNVLLGVVHNAFEWVVANGNTEQ